MEGKYDSSSIGPAQASTFRSSEQIRTDVEELIAENDVIDSADVHVSVAEGVVTLSGRVASVDMALEASEAAREVLGVIEVRNQLEIGA